MAMIECPECKKEISEKANACPFCGYPLGDGILEKDVKFQDNKVLIRTNRSKKVIIGIVLVLGVIIGFYSYNNTLWGDDKAAYDILAKCANYNLEDPSSVRITGGTFDNINKWLYVSISAKNSFGEVYSKRYLLKNDGSALEIGYPSLFENKDYYSTTDFNIENVNKLYRKLWD